MITLKRSLVFCLLLVFISANVYAQDSTGAKVSKSDNGDRVEYNLIVIKPGEVLYIDQGKDDEGEMDVYNDGEAGF